MMGGHTPESSRPGSVNMTGMPPHSTPSAAMAFGMPGGPAGMPPGVNQQQQKEASGPSTGMSELQKLVNMQPQVLPPSVSRNQVTNMLGMPTPSGRHTPTSISEMARLVAASQPGAQQQQQSPGHKMAPPDGPFEGVVDMKQELGKAGR